MPSVKNFRNSYRRRSEGEDLFQIPKQVEDASDNKNKYSRERQEKIIDWITFYRRNVHRFVEHYFGISLYPYQVFWIYWMSLADKFVTIAARADGKTWIVGVFACARAVLYPHSEIVVVSTTKKQAGLMIEKIKTLRGEHPNLAREISNIVTNQNLYEVAFHNGSKIRVVASRESSRGERSTLTIFEEFRLIDKQILDSVIVPFAYVRQVPYLKIPEYGHLIEEPRKVFISSAYHKGLWWFDEYKSTVVGMSNGANMGFIAMDFSVAVRHKIKTIKQLKDEMSTMDAVTVLEEYFNIPWGESSSAYYKLRMFERARTIKTAFYPQRFETYNQKKNPYGIAKTDGEIRLISCDVATRAGKKNDLSINACIRLLPTHKGYARELVHIESYSGMNSVLQGIRVKQLFYDFEADYIVLDILNAGISIYDQLGIVSKDTERGVEYPPMTIMEHESIELTSTSQDDLIKRTIGLNALPVIYPISASAKLNSAIAVDLRDRLQKKMWSFLVDETAGEEHLIKSQYKKEFLDQKDPSSNSFFLQPYAQTSLLVHECIGLNMNLVAGNIKLVESPGGRKDRFTSLAYGNYFASILEKDFLREEDKSDDYDYLASLVQYV